MGQRLRFALPALLALPFHAACGANPTFPEDYVVVAVETAPLSLDPRAAVDAASAQISGLVFRGLTAPAADGGVEPDLAVSWEPHGPLVWRFHLGDATFHDGSPVQADDVVATYRSLQAPTFRALRGDELGMLESVLAHDARTIEFRLAEPHAAFLAATSLGIVPRACAQQAECAVGSGPFRITSRGADTIVLAAAAAPSTSDAIPGIAFRILPDPTARALGLARGSVDLVQNAIEPQLVPWLAERGLDVIATRGSTFQYLGFNLRIPALADVRVRRAIALAIDVPAIARSVLAGLARPAGELFPPSHWAHAGVSPFPHDPESARRLLAEAGVLPLRLEYKTSTVAPRRRIAEAIAGFLSRVGIAVEIRPLEWAALYGDVRAGRFELFSLAWVGVTDPDLYFGWLHSRMVPPRGNNRGGYARRAVDELVERGRVTTEREARAETYRVLAQELERDVPFVPLWWVDNVVVKNRALSGFRPEPTGDLGSLAVARWLERPRRGP